MFRKLNYFLPLQYLTTFISILNALSSKYNSVSVICALCVWFLLWVRVGESSHINVITHLGLVPNLTWQLNYNLFYQKQFEDVEMFNVVQVGWRELVAHHTWKKRKKKHFTNLLMNRNLSFFINKINLWIFVSLFVFVDDKSLKLEYNCDLIVMIKLKSFYTYLGNQCLSWFLYLF